MYIPPALDINKGVLANQVMFERMLAESLKVKEGSRVLDIGCGRGRVAGHVCELTGATITGINIDPEQIRQCKNFAADKGLTKKLDFAVQDINDIPFKFPDNYFDATYHVQVFSLCKDLEKMFAELYRITKPGGSFACLDWVSLPPYDPTNEEHADIMKRVKPLIGAIGTPSTDEYLNAAKKAGFEITMAEDPSNASETGAHQAALIEKAHVWYTRVGTALDFLIRWKIFPKHLGVLFERLSKDGDAFIEADRLGIVTSSYFIVAKKPLS